MIGGVLFGAVGMGYFAYGRRQQKLVPLLCGVGLMVFTFFVSNLWLMLGIGIALIATPFFLRL